jgi:hypothetical protein
MLVVSSCRRELPPTTATTVTTAQHQTRLAPTEERRRADAEKIKPIFDQADKPLQFQGKVCDSNDQPLAGVQVVFTVSRAGRVHDDGIIYSDDISSVVESDASGNFLISGYQGVGLTIHEMRKNGYRATSPDIAVNPFETTGVKSIGVLSTFHMPKVGEKIALADSDESTSTPPKKQKSRIKYVANPAAMAALNRKTLGTPDSSSQGVPVSTLMPNQPPSDASPTASAKPTQDQREYVMIEVTDDGARISNFLVGDGASRAWKVSKAEDATKVAGLEPFVVSSNSTMEVQVSRQDHSVAATTLLLFPAWPDQTGEKQKALLSVLTGDKVLLTVEESDNLQAGWVPTQLIGFDGRQYAKLPRFPKRYYRVQIASPPP